MNLKEICSNIATIDLSPKEYACIILSNLYNSKFFVMECGIWYDDLPLKKNSFSFYSKMLSWKMCILHADDCLDTLKTSPICMVRYCRNAHNLCTGGQQTRQFVMLTCGLLTLLIATWVAMEGSNRNVLLRKINMQICKYILIANVHL